MSVEAGLYQAIGSLVEGRVYPARLPESCTYPAITYLQVAGRAIQSQTAMMRNPRYQVDVWANTFDDMVATCESVIASLDHYRDDNISALFDQELEMPDPSTGLYRRVLEFYIWGN